LFVFAAFLLAFAALGVKMIDMALFNKVNVRYLRHGIVSTPTHGLPMRADIIDRNGVIIATNLPTVHLIAAPRRILNIEDTIQQLRKVFPELRADTLRQRLSRPGGIVYLKRDLTPIEQDKANRLGLPGIDFERSQRRVYLQGGLFAHVVGAVNLDNEGISGIERAFNSRLNKDERPLQLSLDIGVQQEVSSIMQAAVTKYRAIGGTAILMDVTNGRVLSLVSVPVFNPNNIQSSDLKAMFNYATLGVYEMGSAMKLFNTALALDSGSIKPSDMFDATAPMRVGNHTIRDPFPRNRWLSVADILVYSSNIGSVRIAQQAGQQHQQAYMQKFGFFDPLDIELPERGAPLVPRVWRPTTLATVSYGYGLSVTPMHVVAAAGSLVNGGRLMRPTVLEHGSGVVVRRTISQRTSDEMRSLMRTTVVAGTARNANVDGFEVGGKTGTARKVVDGKYRAGMNRTVFISAFPMSRPRYVLLVLLDEPQRLEGHFNSNAGNNAAPTAGQIIAAVAPILGVAPRGVDSMLVGAERWRPDVSIEQLVLGAATDEAPDPIYDE